MAKDQNSDFSNLFEGISNLYKFSLGNILKQFDALQEIKVLLLLSLTSLHHDGLEEGSIEFP